MTDRHEIEDLKARIDLAAIVGHATPLRRAGAELRGPCPFCGGDAKSSRFQVKNHGWHCWNCGKGGDVIRFVQEMHGIGFADAVEILGGRRRVAPIDRRRLEAAQAREVRRAEDACRTSRDRARAIWRETVPAAGSAVETYLRARGIGLAVPASLRCAPDLPYWWSAGGKGDKPEVIHRGPAMVAPIQAPGGALIGVHVTWLAADGSGKARITAPDGGEVKVKKIRGRATGGAIRLGPPAPVWIVGEGIETTLSALETLLDDDTGIVQWCGEEVTAWAGVALGNIAGRARGRGRRHPERPDIRLPSVEPDPDGPGLMPPDWAELAVLLGDGDSDPHITRARIECAARRWARAGVDVSVAWATPGQDFNDMLRETV